MVHWFRRRNIPHTSILLTFILIVAFFNTSYAPFTRISSGVKTVVIDAGHGGKDPGCHGVNHTEKEVALAVALRLGAYIEKNYPDVKVIYTRKTDVFIELNQRAAIANKNNADLFICIHCNASPNKEAYGSETYVMGLHKTKGNLDVAKRENSAILLEDDYRKNYEGFDPNSDEANIIFSMYQNKFLENSLNLAARIQKHYKNMAGRVDKGVRQAGFLVLWKTAMPSLLTETGFLTNREEEKFLGSEKGQDYLALCLFKAFREYKNDFEGKSSTFTDEYEKTPPYTSDSTTGIVKPVVNDTAVTKKEEPKETIIPVEKPTQKKDKKDAKKESDKPDKEIKGVVYKVQILSSEKKLPFDSEKFKGLENVKEYKEKKLFKYTYGECKTMTEATKLQGELRKKGFSEAFIVGFKKGKRINLK